MLALLGRQVAARYRLIPAIRLNSKNPSKSGKAALQFRPKQSPAARAKSFEAVGQRGCQFYWLSDSCAAIAAVRIHDENRTVFSTADFADAGPISSVLNRRIQEAVIRGAAFNFSLLRSA